MNLRKIYEENFSKVKIYDATLWKSYLAIIGIVSSFVTLISFFITAQGYNNNIVIPTILFFSIILIGIFIKMWWNANHQCSVSLKINGTKIDICSGDIFELLNKAPDTRNGEISVIAVNEYFDIIVDDRIVSKKSLHGQYIKKMEAENKLQVLNKVIENDVMLNTPGNYKNIPKRKKGRNIRYSIGSIIEFESYVLAAFTKTDKHNKAYVSAEEYTRFLMRFWENIDEIYAGRTINIPLIGAGITRFRNGKPSKQELLEIMLWSLKISGFHNTYGDSKINIIIYAPDVEDIDFYHIQHNSNFK